MDNVGAVLADRFERIIVENQMLKAGFAALPYVVLRDVSLTVGARLSYAILLSYAWQTGSCFPGQARMAKEMGIGQRTLRRFLAELRDQGYISWKKNMPGGTNTYFLHDVKTKLNASRKPKAMRPPAAAQSGHAGPLNQAIGGRRIDLDNETQEKRLSRERNEFS